MLLVRHGASDPVPVGRTQREKAVFPEKGQGTIVT